MVINYVTLALYGTLDLPIPSLEYLNKKYILFESNMYSMSQMIILLI